MVDSVFQSENSIRGEPAQSCKLRYFNSFEFFDHAPQSFGVSTSMAMVGEKSG